MKDISVISIAQHLNAGFQNSCGHYVGVVKSSNIESEMPSLQSAARGAKPPSRAANAHAYDAMRGE